MYNNNSLITTLTGSQVLKGANITGVNSFTGKKTFSYITKLKKNIFNKLFIPLMNNEFETLNENFYTLPLFESKIKKYITLNKSNFEELQFYLDIISIVRSVLGNNDYTNKLISQYEKSNDLARFVYRLPAIKLKPQYEIYNIIFGKPNKGEKYDDSKLIIITKILNKNDNIPNIDEIKNYFQM